MPLQPSTILLRADQRQVASNPPLPPITKEQILCGELASLLTEEDYNLTTMVTIKLYILCFNNYLFFSEYIPLHLQLLAEPSIS